MECLSQWLKTAKEAKIGDSKRPSDSFWQRVVGEVNGRIIAYANFGEVTWANKPGKYATDVIVLPQFRNQGIGAALYDHVFDTLQNETFLQHFPLKLEKIKPTHSNP